eukprot:6458862-Amphidinium_carterae.2
MSVAIAIWAQVLALGFRGDLRGLGERHGCHLSIARLLDNGMGEHTRHPASWPNAEPSQKGRDPILVVDGETTLHVWTPTQPGWNAPLQFANLVNWATEHLGRPRRGQPD